MQHTCVHLFFFFFSLFVSSTAALYTKTCVCDSGVVCVCDGAPASSRFPSLLYRKKNPSEDAAVSHQAQMENPYTEEEEEEEERGFFLYNGFLEAI
jgi:hypothetical protein